MDEAEFKRRTRDLAIAGLKLATQLPQSDPVRICSRQFTRSITSVGANYRASCRGRSLEEIIAKLSIVEEEADETMYWLELLVAIGAVQSEVARPLLQETSEILAMTVASKRTLKKRAGVRGFASNRESVNREP